jgi:hypothetical protein
MNNKFMITFINVCGAIITACLIVLILFNCAKANAYTYDRHVFGKISADWMRENGIGRDLWGDLQKKQARAMRKWWRENCKEILENDERKNAPHYFPECPTFIYEEKAPKKLAQTMLAFYGAWLATTALNETYNEWRGWLSRRLDDRRREALRERARHSESGFDGNYALDLFRVML